MHLRQLLDQYLRLAGGYGRSTPLGAFGQRGEVERLFSLLEEDYQISRYLHFTHLPTGSDATFRINGFPFTHVSIDAEIETLL